MEDGGMRGRGDWETRGLGELILASYQLSTKPLFINFPAINRNAVDIKSIQGSSDDKID